MGMFKVDDIDVGWHRDGYRIDKSGSPMSRYTQWTISSDGQWDECKPVCFHSLPEDGWFKGDVCDAND